MGMKFKLISKSELKYIAYAGIFGFFYFLYILPFLLSKGVENFPVIIQFLLFSVGIYVLYFFMFKSWSLGTKQSFGAAVIGLIPFLAFDILAPEYHVSLISGVLEKGATLGSASTDYLLGSLWSGLGFTGYILVPMVYLVSAMALLIIVALIKKNFVEEI